MTAKLPEHVSAVSPLGDAIDGTPKPRSRKARSAPVLHEVARGVMCNCGEKLHLYDARDLDAVLHLLEEMRYDQAVAAAQNARARWRRENRKQMENPEHRERHRIRDNARHRERYAADPEYRRRKKAQVRRRKGLPPGVSGLG